MRVNQHLPANFGARPSSSAKATTVKEARAEQVGNCEFSPDLQPPSLFQSTGKGHIFQVAVIELCPLLVRFPTETRRCDKAATRQVRCFYCSRHVMKQATVLIGLDVSACSMQFGMTCCC